MNDNRCDWCDGFGYLCEICRSDSGCDCEDVDRANIDCPECHGTGEKQTDDE